MRKCKTNFSRHYYATTLSLSLSFYFSTVNKRSQINSPQCATSTDRALRGMAICNRNMQRGLMLLNVIVVPTGKFVVFVCLWLNRRGRQNQSKVMMPITVFKFSFILPCTILHYDQSNK